jgi:hypothetical protein
MATRTYKDDTQRAQSCATKIDNVLGRVAGIMEKTPACFVALESFHLFWTYCITTQMDEHNETNRYLNSFAKFT